jgi:hypothetical protein
MGNNVTTLSINEIQVHWNKLFIQVDPPVRMKEQVKVDPD